MMIHLQPIRWRLPVMAGAWRPSGKRVVHGPQIQRDNEFRKANCKGDQHQPCFGIAVGGGGFVVEKSLKKMTQQQRELAAFGPHQAPSSQGVQGQYLWFCHHEKALEVFTHGRSALPRQSLAQWRGYPAAAPTAQRHFQGSAGSSSSQDPTAV